LGESALKYQVFLLKEVLESFRRLRAFNKKLSFISPFTILFYNWSDVARFEDMKPKPAMEQMKISYQPVLLSWELWTRQVYAGSTIRPTAHIVNDSEDGLDLVNSSLIYELSGIDGSRILLREINIPTVPYYEVHSVPIELEIPSDLPTGDYVLRGRVLEEGKEISSNQVDLFIAAKHWGTFVSHSERDILLYDTVGKTRDALKTLNIPFVAVQSVDAIKPTATLIIGEESWDTHLNDSTDTLSRFVQRGGRVLSLRQDTSNFQTSWIHVDIACLSATPLSQKYPHRERPYGLGSHINPLRPEHPVFDGLERARFSLWSDYTGWDQSKQAFPKVFPVTAGFQLLDQNLLSRTAILANYEISLRGVALCEVFNGDGSVILSAFDLIDRIGLDPAADKFLGNLVRYSVTVGDHNLLVDDTHQVGSNPFAAGDTVTLYLDPEMVRMLGE